MNIFNIKNVLVKKQAQTDLENQEIWLDFASSLSSLGLPKQVISEIVKRTEDFEQQTGEPVNENFLGSLVSLIKSGIFTYKQEQQRQGKSPLLDIDFSKTLLSKLNQILEFKKNQLSSHQKPIEENTSNLINEFNNYIEAASLSDMESGKILGVDDTSNIPVPDVIKNNWPQFVQYVNKKSVNEKVADDFVSYVTNSMNGNKTESINPNEPKRSEWEAKSEKYKDLPSKPISKGPKGDVLDTMYDFTPQAKSFIEHNPEIINSMMKTKGFMPVGGYGNKDDAQEALQTAIMTAFSPFIQIVQNKRLGLHKVDFRDGRLRYFLNNPDQLQNAANYIKSKNGQDITAEINAKTPDGDIASSQGAYEVLVKHQKDLFEYLNKLISEKDPSIQDWVISRAKKEFGSLLASKYKNQNIEVGGQDGESGTETKGIKGVASDFSGLTGDEKVSMANNFKTFIGNILHKVSGIGEKVIDYYVSKREYVKADMLRNILSSSLSGVEKLINENTLEQTKKAINSGVISFRNDGRIFPVEGADLYSYFGSLVKPTRLYYDFEKLGNQKIQAKDLLDQGMSPEQVSNQTGLSLQSVKETASQTRDKIKSSYFIPTKEDIKGTIDHQKLLRDQTLELVKQNPGLFREYFNLPQDRNFEANKNSILNNAAGVIYKKLSELHKEDEIAEELDASADEGTSKVVYTPKDIKNVIGGLYNPGPYNPQTSFNKEEYDKRKQSIRSEFNVNNNELIDSLLKKAVARHDFRVKRSIGHEFTNWGETLYDLAKNNYQSITPDVVKSFASLIGVDPRWFDKPDPKKPITMKLAPVLKSLMTTPANEIPDEMKNRFTKRQKMACNIILNTIYKINRLQKQASVLNKYASNLFNKNKEIDDTIYEAKSLLSLLYDKNSLSTL
jgi:hypothetical protein